MNAIEKKIKEWSNYRPDLTANADLSDFWRTELANHGEKPLRVTRERVQTPHRYMEAYKVTFQGFDETPLHGWLLLPAFVPKEKLPCLVSFHGYTGGKGFPEDYASWLLMGAAVFAVDVRGQGGETGNNLVQQHGKTAGWITQNILDKRNCYYMAITIDALKAVELAGQQPEIDPQRLGVIGSSQGGGLALIVSALGDKHQFAIANIPNMCHMDYGIFHSTSSLKEAADYVRRFPDHFEQVMDTLSYFDMLNLADRIRIPVYVSVGLKDPVCMPETVFAAYNRIESPKTLFTYPFHGHETGAANHRRTAEFAAAQWGCNRC